MASKGVNPIQPERMIDYELGYRLINKRTTFRANLYLMDYNKWVVQTGKLTDIGYSYGNVKDSYRAGLELEASFHYGLIRFNLMQMRPS